MNSAAIFPVTYSFRHVPRRDVEVVVISKDSLYFHAASPRSNADCNLLQYQEKQA